MVHHGVELDEEVLHLGVGALLGLKAGDAVGLHAEHDVADAIAVEVDAGKAIQGAAGARRIAGPERAVLPAVEQAVAVGVIGVVRVLGDALDVDEAGARVLDDGVGRQAAGAGRDADGVDAVRAEAGVHRPQGILVLGSEGDRVAFEIGVLGRGALVDLAVQAPGGPDDLVHLADVTIVATVHEYRSAGHGQAGVVAGAPLAVGRGREVPGAGEVGASAGEVEDGALVVRGGVDAVVVRVPGDPGAGARPGDREGADPRGRRRETGGGDGDPIDRMAHADVAGAADQVALVGPVRERGPAVRRREAGRQRLEQRGFEGALAVGLHAGIDHVELVPLGQGPGPLTGRHEAADDQDDGVLGEPELRALHGGHRRTGTAAFIQRGQTVHGFGQSHAPEYFRGRRRRPQRSGDREQGAHHEDTGYHRASLSPHR
jgi:hypothetical protein